MRIALVNWSSRRAGGAEAYLAGLIPALSAKGHDLRLWCETERPADREPITAQPTFALATGDSIPALREWKPDLVYCHGLTDPALERRVVEVAPAIFFAHNYYGTCISGTKTWSFPAIRPCTRVFGPACLAHFYPHRCGGLSPASMMTDYRRQGERLSLLSRYATILTNSTHMRDEYLRHGLAPDRVEKLTFPVADTSTTTSRPLAQAGDAAARLVFIGRMDRLKGGEFLLEALPLVRQALGRSLSVTFAGDGPERFNWERKAMLLATADPGISINFPGWLDRAPLDHLLGSTDLLVFPSVWPEPFGLTGLEAGLRAVPAAAFATGGVTEWLKEGVNGFTAPGDQPSAGGLADAIARCLRNPTTYARLREGALRVAGQFTMENHLRELLNVFERVHG